MKIVLKADMISLKSTTCTIFSENKSSKDIL